jgi:hypothetical protein
MNNNFLRKEIFKLELNLEINNLISILWGYPRGNKIFPIKIFRDSHKILIFRNKMKIKQYSKKIK